MLPAIPVPAASEDMRNVDNAASFDKVRAPSDITRAMREVVDEMELLLEHFAEQQEDPDEGQQGEPGTETDQRGKVSRLFNRLNTQEREEAMLGVASWLHSRSAGAREDVGRLDRLVAERDRQFQLWDNDVKDMSEELGGQSIAAMSGMREFVKALREVDASQRDRSPGRRKNLAACIDEADEMTDEDVRRASRGLQAQIDNLEVEARAILGEFAKEEQEILKAYEQQIFLMSDSIKQDEQRTDVVKDALDYLRFGQVMEHARASAEAIIEEFNKHLHETYMVELVRQREAEHGHSLVPPDESYSRALTTEVDGLTRRLQYLSDIVSRMEEAGACQDDLRAQIDSCEGDEEPEMTVPRSILRELNVAVQEASDDEEEEGEQDAVTAALSQKNLVATRPEDDAASLSNKHFSSARATARRSKAEKKDLAQLEQLLRQEVGSSMDEQRAIHEQMRQTLAETERIRTDLQATQQRNDALQRVAETLERQRSLFVDALAVARGPSCPRSFDDGELEEESSPCALGRRGLHVAAFEEEDENLPLRNLEKEAFPEVVHDVLDPQRIISKQEEAFEVLRAEEQKLEEECAAMESAFQTKFIQLTVLSSQPNSGVTSEGLAAMSAAIAPAREAAEEFDRLLRQLADPHSAAPNGPTCSRGTIGGAGHGATGGRRAVADLEMRRRHVVAARRKLATGSVSCQQSPWLRVLSEVSQKQVVNERLLERIAREAAEVERRRGLRALVTGGKRKGSAVLLCKGTTEQGRLIRHQTRELMAMRCQSAINTREEESAMDAHFTMYT